VEKGWDCAERAGVLAGDQWSEETRREVGARDRFREKERGRIGEQNVTDAKRITRGSQRSCRNFLIYRQGDGVKKNQGRLEIRF